MESDIGLQKIRDLLNGFRPIRKGLEIERKCLARDFNIFSVLRIAHNEVFGHSAFLADLLDVNGNHQQGSLFYDEFINQLKDSSIKSKFGIYEKIFFSIRTEVFFRTNIMENRGIECSKDSRIDILVHYDSPCKKFGIAIENKIYAPDQLYQLERYADYMEKNYGENFLLVYLTREGDSPPPKSISKNMYRRLEEKGLLKLISYQRHITDLLENTIKELKPEFLRHVVIQYLQIIKNGFRNE